MVLQIEEHQDVSQCWRLCVLECSDSFYSPGLWRATDTLVTYTHVLHGGLTLMCVLSRFRADGGKKECLQLDLPTDTLSLVPQQMSDMHSRFALIFLSACTSPRRCEPPEQTLYMLAL